MKSTTIIWTITGVLILGLLVWAVTSLTKAPQNVTGGTQATSTATSTNTDAGTGSTPTTGGTGTTPTPATGGTSLGETYTNAKYNFSISYPKKLNAQAFGNFHLLNQNDWRKNATAQKRGTPVVEIPVVRIENTTATKSTYPRYYTAAVRVGVSTDVAQCYAKDDGYTSQTITDVTIGGVTWKKFIFGDAAMQQYINGASYRTVRNNLCYVVEQLENGSRYTDASTTVQYTDAQLKGFYNSTTAIVQSFRFTK